MSLAGYRNAVHDLNALRATISKYGTQRASTVFAEKVAGVIAGQLTELADAAYDSGVSVFGDPRQHHTGAKNNGPRKGPKKKRKFKGRNPEGKRKGQTALTLKRTGAVRSTVRFVAEGTRLRASLTTKYARFLIGKFGILPNHKSAMPSSWQDAMNAAINAEWERDFQARIAGLA